MCVLTFKKYPCFLEGEEMNAGAQRCCISPARGTCSSTQVRMPWAPRTGRCNAFDEPSHPFKCSQDCSIFSLTLLKKRSLNLRGQIRNDKKQPRNTLEPSTWTRSRAFCGGRGSPSKTLTIPL